MTSLLQKTWQVKTPPQEGSLIERVCKHRQVDPSKDLKEMYSPWLLKDIDIAIARIIQAIEKSERVMIFGDYDVDGVSGATILYRGLQKAGAEVSVRLPHREKDGYGLNTKAIDESAELDVKLLLTVDCGISNIAEVAHANQKGVDIIITDHHAIPAELPKAHAILNPHQKDCSYPFEEVCGSVVAFKLIQALWEKLNISEGLHELIDIAALATVADCMPLIDENRLIVKEGLKQFEQSQHRGLRTLIESYDLRGKPLQSYHLGFNIAPCINAAGRLDDPLIAFKMMIGDQEKALELRQLNQERQEIVKTALEEASEQVERDHLDDPVLVFWQDHWPPGIVGLLAGRLCERYHKPTICLTKHEDKYVGSCRSIPEINIVEALQRHAEIFMNFGGHAQAAGLSIQESKLSELSERLIEDIGGYLEEHPITPKLRLDTEILPEELRLESEQVLSELEPFGMGNPKPKLMLKNITITSTRPVGSDQQHLQLDLEVAGQRFKGIAFQFAEHQPKLNEWKEVDIVCQLLRNEFRGQTSLNLQVIDARPAAR